MSDEIYDPLANFDQALRSLQDIAKLMRCYYAALVDEGFAPEQALALTLAYQTQVHRGGAE